MKYSRTALGLLNAQYRSVLRKCMLINMGLFALGAIATPANADNQAKVGETGYATLKEAMTSDAARSGTGVTLLGNVEQGVGVVVASGANNLTVDFSGDTYSLYSDPVGSAGTETIGFQLLKDSENTFKNGKINVASDKTGNFKRIIQNYSDLTLDGVTIDGTNLIGAGSGNVYVLSNNNGNTTIKNSTIKAADGDHAFDVYYWSQYYPDGANVTLDSSTIIGDIEVASDGKQSDDLEKTALNVKGETSVTGNIENQVGSVNLKDGTLTLDGSITGNGELNIDSAATLAMKGANAVISQKSVENNGKINVLAGKTTLKSTVTGTGTMSAEAGATLDTSQADIEQSEIDLKGATVENNMFSAIGNLKADTYLVDDATTTNLTALGTAGEYNVLSANGAKNIVVGDTGTTVYLGSNATGNEIATQKYVADNAVQTVTTGTTQGTISVDGSEVAVAGLGSAAYTESSAYDAAGTAAAAAAAVQGSTTETVASVNAKLGDGFSSTNTVAAALDGKADSATTLAGYGITDAYTKTAADAKFAEQATTLAGYGITDAYTKTVVDNALATKADSATTLAGYGITDAYTKTVVDNALATKADSATTLAGYGITNAYTKDEVNAYVADNAVQTVTTGTTNGTIKVDGAEVAVAGLGSAAYTDSTAYDASGTAAGLIAGLDASASKTAGTDGLALSITQENGVITAITGSIAANTYDAAGAADDAEANAKAYTNTYLEAGTETGTYKTVAQSVTDGISASLNGTDAGTIGKAISDAQSAAEATAAADATNKASQALADAKAYTNSYLEAGEEAGTYKTVAQSVTDGITTALAENGAIKSAIDTAKQGAIDTAAADATSKANAAQEAAQNYAVSYTNTYAAAAKFDAEIGYGEDTIGGAIKANTDAIDDVVEDLGNVSAFTSSATGNLSYTSTTSENATNAADAIMSIDAVMGKINHLASDTDIIDVAHGSKNLDQGSTVSSHLVALAGAIGNRDAVGTGGYITAGNTVSESLVALDSALGTVEDDLSAEITRATTAEGQLSEAITSTRSEMTANVLALNGMITDETNRAAAVEGQLGDAINAERVRAATAEGQLGDAINAERVRAATAEGQLSEAITSTRSEMTANVLALNGMITDETNRAAAVEGQLGDAINAETTRATAAENALDTKIDSVADDLATETNRALVAEGQLSEAITSTRSEMTANVLALNGMITDETNRAAAVEGQLGDAINAERVRAATAEGQLGDAINAERVRAATAEGQLSEAITSTRSEMTANVLALNGMITDETNRAAAAEGKLGSAINTIGTGIGGTFDAEGQFTRDNFTSTNNIAADDAIVAAISSLDTAMGKVADGTYNAITATNNVAQNLQALDSAFTNGTIDADFKTVTAEKNLVVIGNGTAADPAFKVNNKGAIFAANGAFHVNKDGEIDKVGDITSSGEIEGKTFANTNDTFTVSEDGAIKSASIETTGDATIGGALNVTGLASLDGGINVNDKFTVGTDGKVVAEAITSQKNLVVIGKGTADDPVFKVNSLGAIDAAGGAFHVNNLGAVTAADGKFKVNSLGAITAADGKFHVNSEGDINTVRNITASGEVEGKTFANTNDTFTVDENGNIVSTSVTTGDLGVTGTAWLNNTNVAGNLSVAGTSYLNDTVVDGALATTGDASVGQNFAVAGTSYLHNTVVEGDMAVSGTTKTTALTFDGESYVAAMDQGDAAITNGTVDDQAKRTMATNATVAKTVGNLATLENTHGVTSVADVASAINSLATNVETATGGTFTNNVWKGTVTMAANPDYTYNGATGHANIMAFVNDLATNIGAETTAAKGNIANDNSVNENLDALDEAIGDRRNLGSANEAINQGTKTSVAAGMKAVGDAIGDMNFAGSHYVAGNNDLSGAVRSLDSNLYRVESDLRDLRRDFRRGMASMSAMSALVPNPRAHGNTSLAIGTGAYDGHTAAAIGGFHYLTDNIMLNAGVAWGNSSDAAYRMGVTFSW